MKKWKNKIYAPLLAVVWNLLLVYLVYQVARLEYYWENADLLNYSAEVFRGGLLFDTSAILYTNALYVLLMLFPLHLKETVTFHKICKWLFIIVNASALAINLGDSVYFRYTMRRTTTTVFSEFSNEGNLVSIIGTEFLNHWYLVLLFVVMVAVLWLCYAKPQLNSRKMFHWWRYDVACLLSLLLFVPLCVAGMRGGFTTAVRPITVSNANQYAMRPTDAALVLNTPFSLIRTIGKNVFAVPRYYETQEKLEVVYSPVHAGLFSDTSFSRKNVVVLIVESFGREYIGALNKDLEQGHYKGYTPCVDSLIAKSTTFRYSFCNGRKSIDGMPSILSSIPMFVEPFILTPASMNDFTGLAGISYAAVFMSSVAPGTGAGLELDAIGGAIIGGTSMTGGQGSVIGTLLGVFVMSLLKTGLPYIGLQANAGYFVNDGLVLLGEFDWDHQNGSSIVGFGVAGRYYLQENGLYFGGSLLLHILPVPHPLYQPGCSQSA